MIDKICGCLLVTLALTTTGCSLSMLQGPGPSAAAGLAADLDAIFDDPAFAHAHWGVLVRSLDSGTTLYARNAERLFVPASNAKLLTAAAALETLGPDYRYETIVSTSGPIRDGVLDGSLVIVGTGDPTFSGRFLYNPRDVFRAWADSLIAHGITRVAGGIVAVDTAFRAPTLGAGWAWDDLLSGSAAEFGALQFNEGVVELEIFPSQTLLQPAIIVLTPPTQAVRVTNDTRTLPAGSNLAIRVERDIAGRGIVVRGEVPTDAGEIRRTVSAGNPSHFFATVLRETLREEGIAVEGPATGFAELGAFDTTVSNSLGLFVHRSPPLAEILVGMMMPSQNQIAETALVTVGREIRGESTAEAGAAVVDSLLRAWDVEPTQHRLADGSGLSRYNLASPALFSALLEAMDESSFREAWLASLPVAGRDGTLAGRMTEPPLVDRVIAKTGTLTGVRALSGYLTTVAGERVTFSIIVNNHLLSAADADRITEAALERIAIGS